MHPLDGAKLKIVRAQEHLDAFRFESAEFLNAHPCEIISEMHGEHSAVLLQERVVVRALATEASGSSPLSASRGKSIS